MIISHEYHYFNYFLYPFLVRHFGSFCLRKRKQAILFRFTFAFQISFMSFFWSKRIQIYLRPIRTRRCQSRFVIIQSTSNSSGHSISSYAKDKMRTIEKQVRWNFSITFDSRRSRSTIPSYFRRICAPLYALEWNTWHNGIISGSMFAKEEEEEYGWEVFETFSFWN